MKHLILTTLAVGLLFATPASSQLTTGPECVYKQCCCETIHGGFCCGRGAGFCGRIIPGCLCR